MTSSIGTVSVFWLLIIAADFVFDGGSAIMGPYAADVWPAGSSNERDGVWLAEYLHELTVSLTVSMTTRRIRPHSFPDWCKKRGPNDG